MPTVIDKKAALRRYFPTPFYKLAPVGGVGLEVLLDAFGDQLNTAADETANARAQFLLATAEGIYLQVHGVNVDILRPRGFNMTDDRFRQLVEIVTNSPKNVEQIFERLIALFFGPTAISTGLIDVYSYRNHEIICDVNHNALIIASTRMLLGTTFLHRDPANPYTGAPQASWASTLAAPVGPTDMTATLTSTTGVPTSGIGEFGSQPLIKGFERSGSVLTFAGPMGEAFAAGAAVTGPETPDNYPNGYVYNRELQVDLTQTITTGATQVNVGAVPELFPSEGVVYLGDPTGSAFEAKGYTLVLGTPNVLMFDGAVAFNHIAGEEATVPSLLRMIKTTLNQSVTAGTSLGPPGELTVVNSADFPLVPQAIRLDNGGNVPEIVPFLSRKVGDNTKVLIDPNYVFINSHVAGERVNLMARQTAPRISGFDYAFFLNDTDSLRNAFFNILRRVKVTGCKLVFVVK